MNWKKVLAVFIGLVVFSNILKFCGCLPDSGQRKQSDQKAQQEPKKAAVTSTENNMAATPVESKKESGAAITTPKIVLKRGWMTPALTVEMTDQVQECFRMSNWKYGDSPVAHVEAKAIWVDGFSVGPRTPGMEWDGFDAEGTKIGSGLVHASGEFRKNEPTRIVVNLDPDAASRIVRVHLCLPR